MTSLQMGGPTAHSENTLREILDAYVAIAEKGKKKQGPKFLLQNPPKYATWKIDKKRYLSEVSKWLNLVLHTTDFENVCYSLRTTSLSGETETLDLLDTESCDYANRLIMIQLAKLTEVEPLTLPGAMRKEGGTYDNDENTVRSILINTVTGRGESLNFVQNVRRPEQRAHWCDDCKKKDHRTSQCWWLQQEKTGGEKKNGGTKTGKGDGKKGGKK